MDHLHLFKIFSCRGSRYLAERIASHLGLPLGLLSVTTFSDGEFQPAFDESVRVQPFLLSNLHFLLLIIFLNYYSPLTQPKEHLPTK